MEQFHYVSANVKNNAHLIVHVDSFWGWDRRQSYFTHHIPHILFFGSVLSSGTAGYDKEIIMMNEFRRFRGQSFSTDLSSYSEMGPKANVIFKCIATLFSEKSSHPYCKVLYWNRIKLCYSLLCSAVIGFCRGENRAIVSTV